MAVIKFEDFHGINPGLAPHKRPIGTAEEATNIDFTYGDLRAVLKSKVAFIGGGKANIFKYRYFDTSEYKEKFIYDVSSESDSPRKINFVQGPIPEDKYQRLYFSAHIGGDKNSYDACFNIKDNLKASANVASNAYTIGVPPPTAVPYFVRYSGSELDTVRDTVYVYTYVSKFGEEGPPSTISGIFSQREHDTITLEVPDASDTLISGTSLIGQDYTKRLYRVNPGSTIAEFQFVAEIAAGTLTYDDDKLPEELGEVLPSETWILPPNNTERVNGPESDKLYPAGALQGIKPLPGGVITGFAGRTLCFSEPYQPHAWPLNYRINLADNIVALELVPSGLICLTEGLPRLITGSGPAGYIEQIIQSPYPCINPQSVVNMGAYILYSSSEGIVAIDGSGAKVITEGIISPSQWRSGAYDAEKYKAVRLEGTYLTLSEDRNKQLVLDPRNGAVKISSYADTSAATSYIYPYHDVATDKVYMGDVYDLITDIGGSNLRATSANWCSTTLNLASPILLKWLVVELSTEYDYTAADKFNIILNNNGNKQTFTYEGLTNEPKVLYKRIHLSNASTIELEVKLLTGTPIISRIVLGSSMSEVKVAING